MKIKKTFTPALAFALLGAAAGTAVAAGAGGNVVELRNFPFALSLSKGERKNQLTVI